MKKVILFSLALIALTMAGCAQAIPKISVEGQWGRSSPKVARAGAFFMTIRNSGALPDKLTSGRSASCGAVELHESYQAPDGTMGMRPVTGGYIEIPAGGAVELKAGGYHIMCIEKKVEFNAGVKIPLTLVFEKSGEIPLQVEIRQE